MMIEFTKRAKRVINEFSQHEAKKRGNDTIGPEHMLLALVKEEDSMAVKILKHLKLDFKGLRKEIENRSSVSGQVLIDPLPDKYQKVIEFAREESKKLGHNCVGTEHLLLAILRDNNNVGAASLLKMNINYSLVRAEILKLVGVKTAEVVRHIPRETRSANRNKTPVLTEHSRDLNQMVKEGKLFPVIGRQKEIQRIIQILCRKTKNNPILIGDAGVGKTAIVEGLADRIVNQRIPELLHDKHLVSLDMASLLAGTKYRGEFEDRLKRIIRELRNNPQIIVFIDELHTLIGAGAAEGAIDAANILKPALARGEIQCIGATTLNEYTRYIEKDSALERRFQSVIVKEPSIQDTIAIMHGLAKSFGEHHRVTYSTEALELAVRLSKRHIADRFLPDKAIDIIDEAGARVRLSHSNRPQEIKTLHDEIKRLVSTKEECVKKQEYEKAAKIRDQIESKRSTLDEQVKAWQEKNKEKVVEIGVDDIYTVMNFWTGIPLDKIEEGEGKRLLGLEAELQEMIVGQDDAIHEIARAVRRARTGLKDQDRPSGSFIFLGPTGVGKTQLARSLAKVLFGDEKKLFRLDMSEFMEMHSVSKLIGSPPGYVGYEDSGRLCEYVRRNPYTILLFDEMEKAHPDVFNLLLQILDDGSLTDSHGRRVDFSETIIIITSNIGSRNLYQRSGYMGFTEDQKTKKDMRFEKLMEELKKSMSPEFLNRIDEVIIFRTLERSHVHKIVLNQLVKMNELFLEKRLHVSLDETVLEYITERGYDEKNGARLLRKVLQKEIMDYLSIELLKRRMSAPTEILVDTSDNISEKSLDVSVKTPELFRGKKEYRYKSLTFRQRPWKEYEKIKQEKAARRHLEEKQENGQEPSSEAVKRKGTPATTTSLPVSIETMRGNLNPPATDVD